MTTEPKTETEAESDKLYDELLQLGRQIFSNGQVAKTGKDYKRRRLEYIRKRVTQKETIFIIMYIKYLLSMMHLSIHIILFDKLYSIRIIIIRGILLQYYIICSGWRYSALALAQDKSLY